MRTTTIEHLIYKPKKRLYKTPILFLHGAWHGAWCWDLWLNYFSSLGYETHAISLPGHGNSSMKKWHINLYTLNNYIETLTHHISLISPTPVVIGHSLGGAIVQKYLEKNQLPATVLLATIPTRGMFPMVLRLIRQYPKPILKGIFFLNSYYWINTPKLAKKIFFDDDTQIDAILFHQKLVRESTNLMPLLFPFAKSNPNKSPILQYLRQSYRGV